MARIASLLPRKRVHGALAGFGVFLLLFGCGQWSAHAIASAGRASLDANRAGFAPALIVEIENAFLRARAARLEADHDASARAKAQREATAFLTRLADIEARTTSPDVARLVASIRLAFQDWRADAALPEIYASFNAVMESARADDIERQLSALSLILSEGYAPSFREDELRRLRNRSLFWAVGAPGAAIVLLLGMLYARARQDDAGLVVLDAGGRVLHAEGAARALVPLASRLNAAPLVAALERAVIPFRNERVRGECLLAGLQSGDTILVEGGAGYRVERREGQGGEAVLMLSPQ